MRTILLASIAAVAVTSAASAQATNGGSGYVGVGAGLVNIDVDGFGDVNSYGVLGTAGYDFTPNFGVEGQGFFGLSEDEIAGVDVKINYVVSGYLVGRLPMSDTGSNIFGRVGYGVSETEVSGGGASLTVEDDGFSYGVGGEYVFGGSNAVRFDATLLGENTMQYGVSYIRRF